MGQGKEISVGRITFADNTPIYEDFYMTKSLMKTVLILAVVLVIAAVAYKNRGWISARINGVSGA